MAKTLKDTLKEIQILLGNPQRKIAGTLKYYLDFFNVTEREEKRSTTAAKLAKIQSISHKKITWIDIRNPGRREISELAQKYPFHPLHLEDCLSKVQLQKIEENTEDKYLFLLLRFPYLNAPERKITISQICFFLGQNYLVTIHEDSPDAISRVFGACQENAQQREAFIDNSSAHLLYIIIDHLTDDFFPLLQAILGEVNETEDIVFDDKVSGVEQIGKLRQKIVSLRRTIGPLRALLGELVKRINKFSPANLSVYFDDITHRVERTWETLEEARETVDIYKDADFTISSEKTSRILAILTIIFTYSIPATVVGTFYGMNILLPGGIQHGAWTFWGDFSTFFIILIAATIPAILMHIYFRKRGWF